MALTPHRSGVLIEPITIEPDGQHCLTVRHGDRIAPGLGRDEALWVVAGILMGKPSPWLARADTPLALGTGRVRHA